MLDTDIQTLIPEDQHETVSNLYQKYHNVLKLLVQSLGKHHNSTQASNSLEIHEALNLLNQITQERLSTEAKEWKNDHKQEYKAFFDSIEKEVKEAMHLYFTSAEYTYLGFTLNKFQQLVVEPIINILRKAGPENSKQLINMLIEQGHQTVISVDTSDQDDQTVATAVLQKYAHQRAKTEKKLTKQQRYQLIAKVAERLQADQLEVE